MSDDFFDGDLDAANVDDEREERELPRNSVTVRGSQSFGTELAASETILQIFFPPFTGKMSVTVHWDSLGAGLIASVRLAAATLRAAAIVDHLADSVDNFSAASMKTGDTIMVW